jgi:nucleotide-binding universal stress UspA family protein
MTVTAATVIACRARPAGYISRDDAVYVSAEIAVVLGDRDRASAMLPADRPASDDLDEQLGRVVARCRAEGVEAEGVVVGDASPAHAVHAHARETRAGLIALATHARHGLERLATGSVAADVVHGAPCPVLLVHPAAHGVH